MTDFDILLRELIMSIMGNMGSSLNTDISRKKREKIDRTSENSLTQVDNLFIKPNLNYMNNQLISYKGIF